MKVRLDDITFDSTEIIQMVERRLELHGEDWIGAIVSLLEIYDRGLDAAIRYEGESSGTIQAYEILALWDLRRMLDEATVPVGAF